MGNRFGVYSLDVPDEVLTTIPNLCIVQGMVYRDNIQYTSYRLENKPRYCHFTDILHVDHTLFQGIRLRVLYPNLLCGGERSPHFWNIREYDDTKVMIETNAYQVVRYGNQIHNYPEIPECTPEILNAGKKLLNNIARPPYTDNPYEYLDRPFVYDDFEWKNSITFSRKVEIFSETHDLSLFHLEIGLTEICILCLGIIFGYIYLNKQVNKIWLK